MVNPLIIAHLPDPVGTFNSSELPPPEENKIKKFFMELYRRMLHVWVSPHLRTRELPWVSLGSLSL